MNCFRPIRLAMVALVPAVAISLGIANALAETPAATPPAAARHAGPGSRSCRHARKTGGRGGEPGHPRPPHPFRPPIRSARKPR